MSSHSLAEYEALRATIRERGTARMVLLPVTFGLWGGAAIATTAAIALPIAALLPLLVLAAGFEAVYALHVNVERIGRYIQVFHEPNGGWEHVAMRYGQRFPGKGPDALFSALFLIATALNYLPVALGGTVPELVAVGALHLLLALHIGTARRRASRQRQQDLERFEALKDPNDRVGDSTSAA
jgi:fatty acid desaturase